MRRKAESGVRPGAGAVCGGGGYGAAATAKGVSPATDADVDRRLAELATLHAIGEVLNREPDFAAALQEAVERLVGLVGCRTAWVFLTRTADEDPHYAGFETAASVGLPPALADRDCRALTTGSCECEGMFRRGELDAGVNVVYCSRLAGAKGDRGGLRIHASVPLQGSRAPVGILNLASPGEERFDQQTLSLVDAVGAQLGVAYERALLLAERQREASERAARDERDRVAREVHDSVSQLLFGATLALGVARKSRDVDAVSDAVDKAAEHVEASLAELRRLVELLRSADLGGGLVAALERLAERSSGTIEVTLQAEPLDLPADAAEALYRSAQEGVHNAMRHGRPDRIWIRLERRSPGVALVVEDDGWGPPDDLAPGVGLDSIRARAEALGGKTRLSRRRGGGARLEVTLPWRSAS
jgi:two-component system, NarL family, sensor kinase